MLKLYTFGGAVLTDGEGHRVHSVMAQPKRFALLIYLAVSHPPRAHRRQTLLGLFWPESDEDRARTSLKQAVYYLRRSLGEHVLESRGAEEMALADGVLWSDVSSFEQALAEGRLAAALDLYRGDFLEGFYLSGAPDVEDWIERERARLRTRAAEAALSLAGAAEREGRWSDAVAWARRAVEIEPERDPAIRRLIDLLARSGDRAGAIAAFDAYARMLRTRYEAEPSREMLELIQAVRAGAITSDQPEPVSLPPVLPDTPPTLPSVSGPEPPLAPEPPVQAVPPARRMRLRMYLPVGAAILVLLGIAFLTWVRTPASEPVAQTPVAPHEAIVATFHSPTGDSILAWIVTEAVRIDLGQSPAVRLVDSRAVRQALARMQRDQATPVDAELAREVALREGIPALVTGQVSRTGSGYMLFARVLSPETEATLAAARAQAADSSALLAAIDQLSAKLRQELGESVRSVHSRKPLAQVTTPSLDALRYYSQAIHALDVEGDVERGITMLGQATSIDPGFAMAWRKLAAVRENKNEMTQALDAYERAYQHRDRLTERERLLVEGSYFDALGEPERAIQAMRILVDQHGADAYALAILGYLYRLMGEPKRAADYYAQAVVEDSLFSTPAANLVSAQFSAGEPESAQASLEQFRRRFPNHPRRLQQASYLASAQGNYAQAAEQAERLLREHGTSATQFIAAHHRLAELAAVQGRLATAEVHMSAAMRREHEEGLGSKYVEDAITLAMIDLHLRRSPERALQRVSAALERYPVRSLPPYDRPIEGLAWFFADAGKPERVRAMLEELEATSDPRLQRELARKQHSIRAAVALSEGRADEAVASLRAAESPACPICTLPMLGRAYERSGDLRSAVGAYEQYVNTPVFTRINLDAVWLPYVYEQLERLHIRSGERQKAAMYRQRLADLWENADPELKRRVIEAPRGGPSAN